MARSIILGNGSLTVGLNEEGLVNDFYYPYVGLDNLNTSRNMHHRIGVWVDGTFSWVDGKNWESSVVFNTDALMSKTTFVHSKLAVKIELEDFVDYEVNAFCRRIQLHNLADQKRTIRLFMHQVFEISRAGRGDTALYEPEEHYILDYKGRCSLLIYAQHKNGEHFDQFSVGSYNIEGKEGTYRDAEDGELSGNAVEHGGVDSVIRLSADIEAQNFADMQYWIIAADSQYSAEAIHHQFKQQGLDHRLERSRTLWQEWLAPANKRLEDVDHIKAEAVRRSLLVIKAHMDKRGGIIASCDSSIYNFGRDYYSYVWPRDGAYAIWPLIKLGYQDEPKAFFQFCRDILTTEGYLMHKYQPDKSIGSTWHPLLHGNRTELAIQEDETAIIICMLREYLRYSGDKDFVSSMYTTLIQPGAHFLARFIDEHTNLPHASYDLWEEKFLTSTYTTAVVYRALLTAAELADLFEYPDDGVRWRDVAKQIGTGATVFFDTERELLRKGYLLQPEGSLKFDNVLDTSSFYGAWRFGLYDNKQTNYVAKTVLAIEDLLLDVAPAGGVPRYEEDQYFASDPPFKGNPWFVTTLWLAQYYANSQRTTEANKLIDWALSGALPSGVLSEQVEPTTGAPVSVTPLVWSHAELINTILDIAKS